MLNRRQGDRLPGFTAIDHFFYVVHFSDCIFSINGRHKHIVWLSEMAYF